MLQTAERSCPYTPPGNSTAPNRRRFQPLTVPLTVGEHSGGKAARGQKPLPAALREACAPLIYISSIQIIPRLAQPVNLPSRDHRTFDERHGTCYNLSILGLGTSRLYYRTGDVAKWQGKGLQNPHSSVRIRPSPLSSLCVHRELSASQRLSRSDRHLATTLPQADIARIMCLFGEPSWLLT